MFVISEISKEIPVAPPSINLLGSKKLSSPNAAEKMPMQISIKSRSVRNKVIRRLRNPFASAKEEYCGSWVSEPFGFLCKTVSLINFDNIGFILWLN